MNIFLIRNVNILKNGKKLALQLDTFNTFLAEPLK